MPCSSSGISLPQRHRRATVGARWGGHFTCHMSRSLFASIELIFRFPSSEPSQPIWSTMMWWTNLAQFLDLASWQPNETWSRITGASVSSVSRMKASPWPQVLRFSSIFCREKKPSFRGNDAGHSNAKD